MLGTRTELLAAGLGLGLALTLAGCENPDVTEMQKLVACGKDIDCLSKSASASAQVFCQEPIKKLTVYDMKWEKLEFGERLFTQMRWADDEHRIITYIGDKAKVQTPEGAYINVIYECDINPMDLHSSSVSGVRIVGPGHL